MPVEIEKVLVCDAVDQSCVDLLKVQGIAVDYKLKLPKDQLIAEAKVRENIFSSESFLIATTCKIFISKLEYRVASTSALGLQ